MRSTLILGCLISIGLASISKRSLSHSEPVLRFNRLKNDFPEPAESLNYSNNNDYPSPARPYRRSAVLPSVTTNPISLEPEAPPGFVGSLVIALELRINTGSAVIDLVLRAILYFWAFLYLVLEHLFNKLRCRLDRS